VARDLDAARWIRDGGMGPDALRDWLPRYLAATVRLQHPGEIAHQVGVPATGAAIADLIHGATNNPMALYEMGAAGATLEREVVDWMLRQVGFGEQGAGVLTHGGSLANLTALLAARAQAAPDAWRRGVREDLALLAPPSVHYSITRAAAMLGLGEAAVVELEIDELERSVGKQDQYAAALGGLRCYEFRPDDSVVVTPLNLSDDTLREFEVRVLLFSTGIIRQAPEILKDQDDRTKEQSAAMIANLHQIKQIGHESRSVLERGDLDAYGRLLHEHWEHKRRRSRMISNERVDGWYGVARANGAVGGKLIGAGGGGFLMFCADDPTRLRRALEVEGLTELRFRFDYEGTRILI
jgi:hypothetical protein